MGINAIAGLFLTFLGGYWGSLYCGISSFQNVRFTFCTVAQHLPLLWGFASAVNEQWRSQCCGLDSGVPSVCSFLQRVLIGMVLSIICMLVEVCLFAIHDAKQQKMMEKERKHTFAPNFNSS